LRKYVTLARGEHSYLWRVVLEMGSALLSSAGRLRFSTESNWRQDSWPAGVAFKVCKSGDSQTEHLGSRSVYGQQVDLIKDRLFGHCIMCRT
jgi:hypothetical protein